MKKTIILAVIVGVSLLVHPLTAQTWGATKRLTWNPGDSWLPAIAIDSNNHIHVVWDDDTPGNEEIYYKKSTDGGAAWKTKRLTYNSGVSRNPAIAVDSSDHIHVVWDDYSYGSTEIFYKKSTDGGVSWITRRLTWNPGSSAGPSIAIDSDNHIHVVWYDYTPGNYEIYCIKSTNGGMSWTTKRLTWTSDDSWFPAVAVDLNKHLHVVWQEGAPGNREIYYKKSTDGGTTWSTKRITWTPSDSKYPTLDIDSNNHIHVVWEDHPGGEEIYYKKSTDGGTTWTTKRLTWTQSLSVEASIAVDPDDRLHVIWVDDPFLNIYYKRSTDGGLSWTTRRLTWTSGSSRYPNIFVDTNSHIHVVWNESASGNWEIYYKKGIQ